MACTVADSYDHCRALSRLTARNFYYSFLTLPRDRLPGMCALYAFMRVTDDLGDSDEPEAVRAAPLARWRESLVRACQAGPSAADPFGMGHGDHPAPPAPAQLGPP